jgi:hypothetical protein
MVEYPRSIEIDDLLARIAEMVLGKRGELQLVAETARGA